VIKIEIGLRHAEINEKRLAHALVVVLAGMHQEILKPLRIPLHRFNNRCHLHEIGARTYHSAAFFHEPVKALAELENL